jgi:oligosaccharide reducing-end xylanase
MNIAVDYYWFGKDKAWQQDYAMRLQTFFRSKGIDRFEDQFNPDGSRTGFYFTGGRF